MNAYESIDGTPAGLPAPDPQRRLRHGIVVALLAATAAAPLGPLPAVEVRPVDHPAELSAARIESTDATAGSPAASPSAPLLPLASSDPGGSTAPIFATVRSPGYIVPVPRTEASTTAGSPVRYLGSPMTYSRSPVAYTAALPTDAATAAIRFALAQVGLPYVWGGNGPAAGDAGFDCSGLTSAAYAAAGIGLPRTAHTQFYAGPRLVPDAPLQPGDLVFYGVPQQIHHVGMYLGNGMMVNAPTFGRPVQIAYYRWRGDDYVGATRPAVGSGALPLPLFPLPLLPPVIEGPIAPAPEQFRAPPVPTDSVPPIADDPAAPAGPDPFAAPPPGAPAERPKGTVVLPEPAPPMTTVLSSSTTSTAPLTTAPTPSPAGPPTTTSSATPSTSTPSTSTPSTSTPSTSTPPTSTPPTSTTSASTPPGEPVAASPSETAPQPPAHTAQPAPSSTAASASPAQSSAPSGPPPAGPPTS